ncbi:hypothetical protein SAMN00120144_2050 [Hymenobacter roseosalivarius DSM 11622]|uniref:Lipoprotein n=2 Tax=Hymenobacter roseosalivarius TaxID=89967 RepID=A0A1W1VMR9_9BACT|nr:hypothetical protein SAMN00120144_2050 [Hymenobacter roseosalivarius DSM 11622]
MGMLNKYSASALLFTLVVLAGCHERSTEKSPPAAAALPVVMDDSSRVILDRAIAYAGGYEAWQQKKTLSFDKKATSYDSTGKVARVVNQHFDYQLRPEFRAKVTYTLNDTAITLLHDGQQARKLFNGKVSTKQKDIDGAWNSSYGSEYVMCMPFKLKGPGIKAEYVGQVTLSDGDPAQVKASYSKGAGSNPDHVWYYYFEPGTGKLLANSLNGKNNYWDYTRYEKLEKANGLLLPAMRKGYEADTLNKPGRLISQSEHANMAFDQEFAADHFRIPDAQ